MTQRKSAPKKAKASKPRKPQAAEVKSEPGQPLTLPFEIDPAKLEEGLAKLKEQVVVWAKRGRYTKVRFKFRGKQLLPDLPLAAVAAVEGATFYWAGLLRMLVFNLAGQTVFDVELVNDSEKKLAKGKEALLSGDLEVALGLFTEALKMDAENPHVHLNLGIAHKLKGDHAAARAALQTAKKLDTDGLTATEADRLLSTLRPA